MARTAALLVLLCSFAFSLTAVHGHRDLKQLATPYYYGDYVDECFAGLDVIAALNQTDNLTTLIDAFYAAGLDYTLSDPLLSVTIFAPNDAAFTAAAATLGLSQTQLLNSPLLLPILLYHIVGAPLLTTDLANGEILPTLLEQNLTVLLNTSNTSVTTQSVGSSAAPTVTLNATESKATIVDGDWCNCEVCNVVVQVIDELLLPQIVSVQTNDSEVLITIGNGQGQNQQFLIVYEDLAPAPAPIVATPTLSPPPPATATAPASTGLITEAASTPSTTPSGTSGQKTSAGTTFFTNSALTN